MGLEIDALIIGVVAYHDTTAACFVSEFVGIFPATITHRP